MITLYQFPISHYCEKVRWALDFKRLESKHVNLMPGFHLKQIKKLSRRQPNLSSTTVPIITDGATMVQNSSDIISYLDQAYPQNPLTPLDNENKQEALKWEHYVDEGLGPHIRLYFYSYMLDHPDKVIPMLAHEGPWYAKGLLRLVFKRLRQRMRAFMRINARNTQSAWQHIVQAIDKLGGEYAQRPYLVGNQFTRADLAAAALFAPLCLPAQYDVSWPEEYPQGLRASLEQVQESLAWVKRIYADHRFTT